MKDFNRVAPVIALTLAICLGLASGCGGPSYEGAKRGAVSGTVTLDGNPLPYGSILFMAQDARMTSAVIQDGAYAIPEEQGPNVGECTVQITGYAQAPVSGETADDNAPAPQQIVPPQYNTGSTLKVTIAAGPNKHDFDLTSK